MRRRPCATPRLERIQEQRRRGDSWEAWTEVRAVVTVDRLPRARRKMMMNDVNGPGDCLVSEMLWELPMKGSARHPHRGQISVWCS